MEQNEYIRAGMGALRTQALLDENGPPHIYDELADFQLVGYAANAMREKLALARSRGRGGWWDETECTIEHLRSLLRGHIEKGDMRDVLNLAAMIYVREIADLRPNTQ